MQNLCNVVTRALTKKVTILIKEKTTTLKKNYSKYKILSFYLILKM